MVGRDGAETDVPVRPHQDCALGRESGSPGIAGGLDDVNDPAPPAAQARDVAVLRCAEQKQLVPRPAQRRAVTVAVARRRGREGCRAGREVLAYEWAARVLRRRASSGTAPGRRRLPARAGRERSLSGPIRRTCGQAGAGGRRPEGHGGRRSGAPKRSFRPAQAGRDHAAAARASRPGCGRREVRGCGPPRRKGSTDDPASPSKKRRVSARRGTSRRCIWNVDACRRRHPP